VSFSSGGYPNRRFTFTSLDSSMALREHAEKGYFRFLRLALLPIAIESGATHTGCLTHLLHTYRALRDGFDRGVDSLPESTSLVGRDSSILRKAAAKKSSSAA
jgi:hypothetical protein